MTEQPKPPALIESTFETPHDLARIIEANIGQLDAIVTYVGDTFTPSQWEAVYMHLDYGVDPLVTDEAHSDYYDAVDGPTQEDLDAMEACIPDLIAANPALADYFE